ncbi:lysozyme inhibitor LprI family protein [Burkholderia seminalis]|uniref:lysozyme inhibitor LprI family protein n=1 Tax=Burkholderia seminalis TaxID=488731 RepID=UPI00158A3A71|nr:lysozyme inhibitor LprI family protein [Burkholderia seminalis]
MLERLAALALCAVVTAPAAVAAQPDAATGIDPIDRTMTQCLNDPEHASTAGQDECVVDANRAWDARLNASYRALQASLPAADRPALLRAQRAWLARRDADLKLIVAVYATTRGTIYALMNANDVMELTRLRALSLQRFEADRAAHGFSLATRLPLATNDRPERVDAVPGRGARFERAHCAALADLDAKGRCAAQATPLYLQDIDDVTAAIERRLPRASREAMRASSQKWRAFIAAQPPLISALYAPADVSGVPPQVSIEMRDEAAARLQQLVYAEDKIGAD